jgi:hypothetical protein
LFSFFLISSVWVLGSSFLGFLLLPVDGELYGMWLGIISLSFLAIFCKQVILALISAKKLDDFSRSDIVRNYCYQLGMAPVKTYQTPLLPNNLFYLESFLFGSCLIFGKNIEKDLQPKEMNILIFSSLLKIKEGKVKYLTMNSLLLAICSCPAFLFSNTKNNILFLIRGVFYFIISPVLLLRMWLFKKKKNIINFDQKIILHTEDKKDFASALYKISQKEFEAGGKFFYFSGSVMENLSIAYNQRKNLLEDLLKIKLLNEERYSRILSNR